MSNKIMTIKLRPYPNPDTADGKPPCYFVERITDSLAFEPGTFLDKRIVEELVASKEWKVTLTQ